MRIDMKGRESAGKRWDAVCRLHSSRAEVVAAATAAEAPGSPQAFRMMYCASWPFLLFMQATAGLKFGSLDVLRCG